MAEFPLVFADGSAALGFSPAEPVAHDGGGPSSGGTALIVGEPDYRAAQQDIADGTGTLAIDRVGDLRADIGMDGADRLCEIRLGGGQPGDIGGYRPVESREVITCVGGEKGHPDGFVCGEGARPSAARRRSDDAASGFHYGLGRTLGRCQPSSYDGEKSTDAFAFVID